MCQLQIAVDARIGRVKKNNHAKFWALVAYFCSPDLVVKQGIGVFAAKVNRYKGCADLCATYGGA